MSRSYKKKYRVKDHNKGQKQIANRKLRRTNKLDSLQGGSYKKAYLTWNICDYNYTWSKEEAIEEWYQEESDHYTGRTWRHDEFGTLENWLNYWEKCVRRK